MNHIQILLTETKIYEPRRRELHLSSHPSYPITVDALTSSSRLPALSSSIVAEPVHFSVFNTSGSVCSLSTTPSPHSLFHIWSFCSIDLHECTQAFASPIFFSCIDTQAVRFLASWEFNVSALSFGVISMSELKVFLFVSSPPCRLWLVCFSVFAWSQLRVTRLYLRSCPVRH